MSFFSSVQGVKRYIFLFIICLLPIVPQAGAAGTGNLAAGRPALAFSQQKAGLAPSKAIDGNGSSRWSSEYSDSQWIYVDLGRVYPIDHVLLNWERAYGKAYEIQVSTDAKTWTPVFIESNGNGGIDDISFAAIDARYVRMLGRQRATKWGYSLWEFEVYGRDTLPVPQGNLTLWPALASSQQKAGLAPSKAIDGNGSSRWSSEFSDSQWIYVDLGRVYPIDHVLLNWERAYGKAYEIQISTDAKTWTPVFIESNGNGGIDDISFAAIDARYVRMLGRQRATKWGYSLWEFEVYGVTSTGNSTSLANANTTQSISSASGSGSNDFTGGTTVNTAPQTAAGIANLNWSAPVSRTDGDPLPVREIAGYTLYYGIARGNYSNAIRIDDPFATSIAVTDLPPATYYFVVTARDINGLESTYSQISTRVIQ